MLSLLILESTDKPNIQFGYKNDILLYSTFSKCGRYLDFPTLRIEYGQQRSRRHPRQRHCRLGQNTEIFYHNSSDEILCWSTSDSSGYGCLQSCHSAQIHWSDILLFVLSCSDTAAYSITEGLQKDIPKSSAHQVLRSTRQAC